MWSTVYHFETLLRAPCIPLKWSVSELGFSSPIMGSCVLRLRRFFLSAWKCDLKNGYNLHSVQNLKRIFFVMRTVCYVLFTICRSASAVLAPTPPRVWNSWSATSASRREGYSHASARDFGEINHKLWVWGATWCANGMVMCCVSFFDFFCFTSTFLVI